LPVGGRSGHRLRAGDFHLRLRGIQVGFADGEIDDIPALGSQTADQGIGGCTTPRA